MVENRNPQEIVQASSLIELAEALGFVETLDMRYLRAEVIRCMLEETDCFENYRKYEEAAEKQGLLRDSEGQISLLLMKALMFLESGDGENHKREMQDAIEYASGAAASYPQRFSMIVEAIQRLMA